MVIRGEAKRSPLGPFPSGPLTLSSPMLPRPPHMTRPYLSLSLCPPCHPQISNRHKLRLLQVLETVIGASESLEERWTEIFMKLALENMTTSTVGSPSPQGSQKGRQLPQDPHMLALPGLWLTKRLLPIFSLSYHQPRQRG